MIQRAKSEPEKIPSTPLSPAEQFRERIDRLIRAAMVAGSYQERMGRHALLTSEQWEEVQIARTALLQAADVHLHQVDLSALLLQPEE